MAQDETACSRICRGLGFAAALVLVLAGARPAYAALTDEQRALHALDRLSFGPRPGDLQQVLKIGPERYIDGQLHPERIAENPDLTAALKQLPTLAMDYADLAPTRHIAPDDDATRDLRARIDHESDQQRMLRAVLSTHQLQEVMVDFWYNHFNVYAFGHGLRPLVGSYENSAIRPFVLGRFRDLLGATAHHPAMLLYLDNVRNVVRPDDPTRAGLNENYARELMELHTLGVDGGYTQADVISLAAILSGWRLPPDDQPEAGRHGFLFDAAAHAPGDKPFLGQTIRAGGEAEGERALDLLAKSPATAHHIAFALAQYFVADAPDPALVDRLAARFRESDGDIRAVLATLFASPQFWSDAAYEAKFKTPFQYVASALRAGDVAIGNGWIAARQVALLGQPLYGNLTPDGYKNTESAWLSPDAVMRRTEFAKRLGAGHIPFGRSGKGGGARETEDGPGGTPVDADRLQATLHGLFGTRTTAVVQAADPDLRSALLLASPEFMMR